MLKVDSKEKERSPARDADRSGAFELPIQTATGRILPIRRIMPQQDVSPAPNSPAAAPEGGECVRCDGGEM